MSYIQIYLFSLILIQGMMALLWLASIRLKNVSIVDPFWGLGFVIVVILYYLLGGGFETRKILVLIMVAAWGVRLSIFLWWRNSGKGEDFRYKQFRKDYGENRYWWISYFQVFLLQGILMWLISAPLLAAQFYGNDISLGWLDYLGILLWVVGFAFEAGGDFQLAKFKSNPENKGKVLDTGFWHYTRHPNYFGDTAVWWGFACICMAAGSYIPVLGSLLMTVLIIKVSGVALLEKTLKNSKPQYADYVRKTSAFIPWLPKEK